MPVSPCLPLPPGQQTVLIVEDEFAVANDLQNILRKAGYVVSGIAPSVSKALEMNRNQRPDLVLLDINLKGPHTGIDLAHQLRQEYIPFVFMSANTTDHILQAVKDTQPGGFIVKPFRARDVLVALEMAYFRHALCHGSGEIN